MHRSRVFALLAAVILLASAVPGHATPLDDKRSEAELARDAVEQLDVELEIAAEDYNEAAMVYEAASARVAENEARLASLNESIGVLETRLGSRAVDMYRDGPLGILEVLLGAGSFAEFAATWDMLMEVSASESAEAADLKAARAEAETAEAELASARAEAEAGLEGMSARKAEVESALAERRSILTGLEDEVADLEAEERRAQEAAAAAARAASPRTSRGDSGGDPSRAPRSEVVEIAKRYLGTPYRWGAAGPDAFDCSGFTMYVYAQVGVSLPHSSRAQYHVGERVSRADLAPGDLVFFGLSRIHHVGMYVGDGEYIHSPRTGDVVRISPLDRSDYAGAVRP